jgi:hypothetical protein
LEYVLAIAFEMGNRATAALRKIQKVQPEKFSVDAIGVPRIVDGIFARSQKHEPLATVQGRMEM